jgi:L-malate glycosyltransferase
MSLKRKTICFLADIRSIHTQRWVGYFADKYNCHLITFDYPEEESKSRVEIGDAFFKSKNVAVHKIKKFITAPFVVDFLLSLIKPDLVHAHFVTQYGFFGAFSHHHPLVITAWGDDVLIPQSLTETQKFLYTHIAKYALRRADVITCDGENTYSAMICFGANAARIHRIYFGVDTSIFRPLKMEPQSSLERLGEKFKPMDRLTDNDPKSVIYLRGFDKVYDPYTLIRAIPMVLKECPNTHFRMIGGGSELSAIQNVIYPGIEDRKQYIGRVPIDAIPSYLNISDVYVNTSISDSGLAASTAEAMACGIPVVTTDVGDARKWIKDGVNGFVVEKGNSWQLAEKIIALLKDDQLRKQFSQKGREIIVEKQDYNKEMDKMNKLYQQLMKVKV